jgi:zinc D-Ala-D-Ala dipeptidase
MADAVVLCDQEVLGLPILECGEPMVDLREVLALRVDRRRADPQGRFALVRLALVDRLVTAQTLLPAQLRLLVVEGFRPPWLQARYFDECVERLRREHPQRDEEWLRLTASRHLSPPQVAAHVTGAAVDVTLCTIDGVELAMGTPVNDVHDERCHTATDAIGAQEAQNRRILVKALSSVGLVNYPTEWWHWSYGDRYWAFRTGAGAARYGPR